MKLAVIDSGVAYINNKYLNCSVKSYESGSDKKIHLTKMYDNIGHGTAVCNILTDRIPDNYQYFEILNIKIFEDDLIVDVDTLIAALRFCYDEKVDIINLSLGTYSYNKELEQICLDLYNQGCLIFAANDGKSCFVYPANFKSVISIYSTNDSTLIGDHEFIYIDDQNMRYNVWAYGGMKRVNWKNHKQIIISGSSFACPVIIAFLLTIHQNGIPSFDTALYLLKKNSKFALSYEKNFSLPIIKDRVALFPFNKEMHSVIRFNKTYNITSVFDMPGRGILGKNVYEILNETGHDPIFISNICDESNYCKFDSIIIGDCSALYRLYGDKIKKVFKNLKYHNKAIYTFMENDDLYEDVIKILPTFNVNYFKNKLVPIQKYYENLFPLTPILGIYGTGSSQGKFTLQNRLVNFLENIGLEIGFLSTEQQGSIIGCDAVFPYGGFNDSQIKLPPYWINCMYEYILKSLSLSKSDLIVTGGQSGIISKWSDTNKSILQNIDLLFLTKPDVTILVVNFEDHEKIIQRAIDILKAFTGIKIACVVVYKLNYKTHENFKKWCDDQSTKYKLKFLSIDNIPEICSHVLESFKKK